LKIESHTVVDVVVALTWLVFSKIQLEPRYKLLKVDEIVASSYCSRPLDVITFSCQKFLNVFSSVSFEWHKVYNITKAYQLSFI